MSSGLVLAAGASTRMGRPKALLELAGETFVARIVRLLADAGCDPVRVVAGAHFEAVAAALPGLVVQAPDWAEGMRTSLRTGLRALPPGPVLLTHVDRPWVAPSTLAALLLAPEDRVAVPRHAGVTGHPVRLPAALRARLLETDDVPLRDVLAAHPQWAIDVDDPGVLLDADTPAEYEALRSRLERA